MDPTRQGPAVTSGTMWPMSSQTKDFFMSDGCDKFLHMSCVRSYQESAYNGSVAIERAGYAVIGFCETCFRLMEAARTEEHDTEED